MDRIIAPIIGETHLCQALIGMELLHWEQLQSSDAERCEVFKDGWVGQTLDRSA